jgi:hypothetical protein
VHAMRRQDELTVLLRTARRLSDLCAQGAAHEAEARDHYADAAIMAAARRMHSETLRTKHAAEDALVAFVLDCSRCGRRVHWVPSDGCESSATGLMRSRHPRITGPSSGDMTLAWASICLCP